MLRRAIAYVLLVCYLPACTSWRVERGLSPAQVIATQQPDTIRVTRTDGRRFVLEQPSIVAGDSMAVLYRGVRARVALADIAQVETRRFDSGMTGVFLVGVAALTLVVGYLALKESMSNASWGWY
jgi:hypothetical protein